MPHCLSKWHVVQIQFVLNHLSTNYFFQNTIVQNTILYKVQFVQKLFVKKYHLPKKNLCSSYHLSKICLSKSTICPNIFCPYVPFVQHPKGIPKPSAGARTRGPYAHTVSSIWYDIDNSDVHESDRELKIYHCKNTQIFPLRNQWCNQLNFKIHSS